MAANHDGHAYRARCVLNRAYDTPMTLDQLGREVALASYYLIRLFHRTYKQTPHQYMMQQRIMKAKHLLRSSDLSITDICAVVGFESLGSFSTLFRKIAGISPSAYRRSAQATLRPAYIPLCACLLHGIDDEQIVENSAIFEK